MYCLNFIRDLTLSNRSWQVNFIFKVEQSYMISHIIVLSHLRPILDTIHLVLTIQYRIRKYHTCTIVHIVVLSGFLDKPHFLPSIIAV